MEFGFLLLKKKRRKKEKSKPSVSVCVCFRGALMPPCRTLWSTAALGNAARVWCCLCPCCRILSCFPIYIDFYLVERGGCSQKTASGIVLCSAGFQLLFEILLKSEQTSLKLALFACICLSKSTPRATGLLITPGAYLSVYSNVKQWEENSHSVWYVLCMPPWNTVLTVNTGSFAEFNCLFKPMEKFAFFSCSLHPFAVLCCTSVTF